MRSVQVTNLKRDFFKLYTKKKKKFRHVVSDLSAVTGYLFIYLFKCRVFNLFKTKTKKNNNSF